MIDLHTASNKMRYDLMHGGIVVVLGFTNVLGDEQKGKVRSTCNEILVMIKTTDNG